MKDLKAQFKNTQRPCVPSTAAKGTSNGTSQMVISSWI